jgi:hypothetical protein
MPPSIFNKPRYVVFSVRNRYFSGDMISSIKTSIFTDEYGNG